MNLNKELRRLKNLKQNRDKSEEDLIPIAKENLQKQELLSSLTFCLDSEKPLAIQLLENYLEQSSFENFSERDTLTHLIGLEILAERIKQFLKIEAEKANPGIPLQMVDQLTNLNNQIMELKESLGLIKKEENNSSLEEWNKLKKKALNYYKENEGCNVLRCPHCQKLFMILKDIRNYEAKKLPLFKRTILYNKELYELYDKGIITKEKLASIFGVNPEYIQLIYENEFKNDK